MCRRVCLWLAVRLPPTMETCIRWWYFKPESSDVEVTAFLAVTHLTSPGVRHPPGADPLVIRGRNQCRCLFLFFFTSQGTSRLQEALYKEEDISRKKKTRHPLTSQLETLPTCGASVPQDLLWVKASAPFRGGISGALHRESLNHLPFPSSPSVLTRGYACSSVIQRACRRRWVATILTLWVAEVTVMEG